MSRNISIILKESVRKLGKVGESVKVKAGYARNFLIPYNKAVFATKENLASLEQQFLSLKEENDKKLEEAKGVLSSLDGKFIILVRQAAAQGGRLFGSVTTRDVAEALMQMGFSIHHRNLSFTENVIKSLGEYTVKVELHAEVIVPVTLYVVKSNAEANELRQVKSQIKKVDDISDNDQSI
ncbi:MAG: 50S ribosomal protein L9 [Candidatus Mesenet longicola]|uniref:Large ribosomal subunit protein bL9 n=1 Tax=Candidatus Mesenet longicola TaxID=1892558 RepID=A0A8J3MPB0_9RICK|nr:MAG: 50S ribosomal protein L9 [Candidatus Mesenet longicola]GHM59735.1 MAG: 50S ribosomal protein L9 [Candidatus Mesenet longicola]